MSFHRIDFKRMNLEESNISDSDLMSINCVGNDSLLFIKIALFRIKSCRRVRFC